MTGTSTRPAPARSAFERVDRHGPSAGIGGAAPARSALGLRLVLASLGVAMLGAALVLFVVFDLPRATVAVVAFLIVASLADVLTVARRIRVEHGQAPGPK